MPRRPLVSTLSRSARSLLMCAAIWGCALGWAQPARAAETAAFDQLKAQFDADKGMPRLVLLLSPTCIYCVGGAQWIEDNVLSQFRDFNIRVYAVWYEMLPSDSPAAFPSAKTSLPDRRVTHFWDARKDTGRWYKSNVLSTDYHEPIMWDAYYLYDAQAEWGKSPSRLVSWGRTILNTRGELLKRVALMAGKPAPAGGNRPPAVPAAESAIPWQKDIRKASAAALPANKPMLIEFWADWCPPCKVMDAEVYTDPGVIKAMAKVMPVKIDVDKPDDALVRKYDVVGMPLLLFADSYGNELFRFSGTITVDTMIQLLQELPGDVTTINRLGQILARDKDNFEALEGLGRELKSARLFRASNLYYERAVRVGTVPKQAPQRGDVLLALGHNHLELKEFREAERMFERYLGDFNGGPAEPEAMLGLGRALLYQDKRADAKRALQKLTGRYKNGPASTEATRLLASL